MAPKKSVFTEIDLEWAEFQLNTWREYVEKNPINLLTDRKDLKGKVISKIEDQITSIRNTMKDYLALIKEVENLRAAEVAKKEAKGGGDIPYRMRGQE